jgi:hypothetical protein
MRLKYLNLLVCSVLIFMSGSAIMSAQPFKILATSDLVRVFEDGYKLPPMNDTVKVFGIRGEIISGQIALNAKNNLTNVSVDISVLKDPSTGNSLPGNAVEWNFVGCIPLSKNTPNQPQSALIRTAPARFPDYLMAERQLNVNKGTWQSIWLTVNIPENAKAGNYAGKAIVKSDQGDQSLPVSLTIYPFLLPEKRHLKVVEWYTTDDFARFHGIKEIYSDAWFAMLHKYADNIVAHRQNTFRVPMETIEIRKSKDGQFEFDFTHFDQISNVFWDTKKMDYLETGFLTKFGEGDWFSTEIKLSDLKVKISETGVQATLPGSEVAPYLLPAFEDHLRQKGWLNKTYFHIKDEPSVHNAAAWREMSSYIHKYAPDLIRMDAIETTFLLDDIEVAVPKLDALATWYDEYKKSQQKGTELWFYTVGIYQGSVLPNKTIDMPLIDSRIMHWLNYKYDITGYLHWGWNQWTEDPYKDTGENFGDAWHVYPVKDGVLNSMRWEEMRNGLQDYEYLWLLENKICALKDSLGSRFSRIDQKQRGKEIASQVVMGFTEHTYDPSVLNNARMNLIKELIEFDKSPRIYVQTTPLAHSTMTGQCSSEVFGWTEPGTKIIINDKTVPVSQQGLFVEQFVLTPADNKIRVKATNEKGSKEIIRNFVIK